VTLTIKEDIVIMDQVYSKNIGALITPREGSLQHTATSGSTGDNTTQTGIAIDRKQLASTFGGMPESMVASVVYDATLASGSGLAVQVIVLDSADNSSFANYASNSSSSVQVATGISGGGVSSGIVNLAVNLSSARRYIRIDHIPRLLRGGTDTSVSRAIAVMGGMDRLPAPA
jgi:hypothetical protein